MLVKISEARAPTPVAGKMMFTCPVCDGFQKLTVEAKPPGSDPQWFVNCWSAGCRDLGGEYIRELARAVGAPHGFALLADPLRYLDDQLGPGRASRLRDEKPQPLPDRDRFDRWSRQLRSNQKVMRWLKRERCVNPEIAKAAMLGWDDVRSQLVFPLRRGSEIVNLKTKQPQTGSPMIAWAGLRAEDGAFPLFPELRVGSWVILCEGELDALCARSAGLPAVSVTLGCSTFLDEWTEALEGRKVVVAYDVGAEAHARKAIERLREAGGHALQLDLKRDLGMRHKGEDLTDFFRAGGSRGDIIKAIKARR